MASLGTQKILLGQAAAFGAPGSYYTAQQNTALALGANFVLPAGNLFIAPNADIEVQYSADGGVTWNLWSAASVGAQITSDGFSWRLLCVTAATTAIWWGVA